MPDKFWRINVIPVRQITNQQFEAIDINFHPKLTILTGSKGAGKTTLVKILARNFGWNFSEIATPFKKKMDILAI